MITFQKLSQQRSTTHKRGGHHTHMPTDIGVSVRRSTGRFQKIARFLNKGPSHTHTTISSYSSVLTLASTNTIEFRQSKLRSLGGFG